MSYIKFSEFTPAASTDALELVGLQGGKNTRVTFDLLLQNIPALRTLAASIGATYSEETKKYSLNGLTDITDAQMADIILSPNLFGKDFTCAFRGYKGRTNYAKAGLIVSGSTYNLERFVAASNIEVLVMPGGSSGIKASSISYFADTATKLRTITNLIDITSCSGKTLPFTNCPLLETVQLKGLNFSISFKDSPNLSKESILYMIQNSVAGSPITITLHPTAYAMATADSEIQAALNEKNNVSLAL